MLRQTFTVTQDRARCALRHKRQLFAKDMGGGGTVTQVCSLTPNGLIETGDQFETQFATWWETLSNLFNNADRPSLFDMVVSIDNGGDFDSLPSTTRSGTIEITYQPQSPVDHVLFAQVAASLVGQATTLVVCDCGVDTYITATSFDYVAGSLRTPKTCNDQFSTSVSTGSTAQPLKQHTTATITAALVSAMLLVLLAGVVVVRRRSDLDNVVVTPACDTTSDRVSLASSDVQHYYPPVDLGSPVVLGLPPTKNGEYTFLPAGAPESAHFYPATSEPEVALVLDQPPSGILGRTPRRQRRNSAPTVHECVRNDAHFYPWHSEETSRTYIASGSASLGRRPNSVDVPLWQSGEDMNVGPTTELAWDNDSHRPLSGESPAWYTPMEDDTVFFAGGMPWNNAAHDDNTIDCTSAILTPPRPRKSPSRNRSAVEPLSSPGAFQPIQRRHSIDIPLRVPAPDEPRRRHSVHAAVANTQETPQPLMRRVSAPDLVGLWR